jgi:hypothetical protein
MTTTAIKPCPHHWNIDTPSGKPTVHGVCKLCGEEKEFPSFDEGIPGPEPGDITEGKSYKPHQRIRLGPWRGPKKKEVTVPKISGGSVTTRSKELRPARRAAEELFRKGNSVTRVLELLRPTFGDIAPSTVTGWKTRMPKVAHPTAMPIVGRPLETPRLFDAVMAARPPFAERERCRRWKQMFDAAFELLVQEG